MFSKDRVQFSYLITSNNLVKQTSLVNQRQTGIVYFIQIWFYIKQEIITSDLWLRRATVTKLEQNHNYLWCVIPTAAYKRSLDCWKPVWSI